ncbi:hypothetical protein [Deinococcus pimensis]|nr:hypothetical protein [Deinococcus pimensis]
MIVRISVLVAVAIWLVSMFWHPEHASTEAPMLALVSVALAA